MDKVPYTSVVGSIMYVMICTRPDLCYSISMVSRFMGKPGVEHWNAVKWIMRYLNGTKDVGLNFGTSEDRNGIRGFVDSDYAGDIDSRRSQ